MAAATFAAYTLARASGLPLVQQRTAVTMVALILSLCVPAPLAMPLTWPKIALVGAALTGFVLLFPCTRCAAFYALELPRGQRGITLLIAAPGAAALAGLRVTSRRVGHPEGYRVSSHRSRTEGTLPPGGSKPVEPEPGATPAQHLPNAGGGPGAGRRTAAAAKAASLDAARSHPLTWRAVLKRALVVAAAGAALYLVLPGLTEVLASWPRLSTLEPLWLVAVLAAEIASFTCYFALQQLALQTRGWFAVVTAGLAGNSISGIVPGGSAVGAAVQFRMLSTAGFDPDTAVGGLTALSLLNVGALLGLPVFALPAVLAGAPVSPGLVHAALVGAAGFCLLAIFGALILHTDWPLAAAGRAPPRACGTGSLVAARR